MGTRALFVILSAAPKQCFVFEGGIKTRNFSYFPSSSALHFHRQCRKTHQIAASSSALQPPDVSRLAETARISLTEAEIEEFAPKIRQVVDWFGQLQAVDVNSVEPAIRAEMESGNLREDVPETFQNRDKIITSIPSFEEPYLKVPKVINKE
ncbi:PREDICTED: glutamyl-tRNA(Gln) amidotransferase subunit C, chloroplastic/mitochondrial [Tarenaya hassleriana]|uniref:glutamyl-tRNA(Gln) amidotransferase subunit C, chloroplastic/mitochondrial n=1 Tax=Tarenaya hassleriana TaxID=28532 RepID=UPI00053C67A1|nr:PREDICTED: glutamyl-tRNA(Gln) amidotransferase subunit C, chloroplastic/mitochondrial [Tarenaya hassleriana]